MENGRPDLYRQGLSRRPRDASAAQRLEDDNNTPHNHTTHSTHNNYYDDDYYRYYDYYDYDYDDYYDYYEYYSTSKSAPNMVCFAHFDFEISFAPQRRAIFISHPQMASHPPL
jgi:hypothetical protein